MKNKTTLILIAVILFCLALTAYTQTQRNVPAGQGWEYQEIQILRTESALPKLNAHGAQGWELVNVVAACEDSGYCTYWAYMKRRK